MSSLKAAAFIHIGTHKTGTTSVQYFLDRNRDLLKKNNIHYPVSGIPSASNLFGHHELAWLFYKGHEKERSGDDIWVRLKSEIKLENSPCIVLSSEDFYNPQFNIALMKKELEGMKVKIIVYLRNYIGFLRALYFEGIKKNNFSSSFRNFVLKRKNSINYNSRLKKWGKHFGAENIIIRLYDSIEPGEGLLRDFSDQIGFDFSLADGHPEKRLNITVSDKMISIIRALNKLEGFLPRKVAVSLRLKEMRAALAGNHLPKGMLFRILSFLAGKNIYSRSDLRFLKRLIDEMETDLLLEKIGEEGILLLRKGL